MDVNCQKCSRRIDSDQINVQKDTAYCDRCGKLFALSSLLHSSVNSDFDINEKVRGTLFTTRGGDWVVEASHRSLMALFFVPFTLVWSGGSLGGIYGSQLLSGQFNLEQSLFGIPFLIGSVVLIALCLMSLFGRTVVSSERGKGLVFMGVGPLGWYRRFDWADISRVEEVIRHQNSHLVLEGKKRLGFGWGLTSGKRYFVANAIRSRLH